MYGPDPDKTFPNEKIRSLCFIKNVITRPNIIAGDYTYYDDDGGAEKITENLEVLCGGDISALMKLG